jgi:hypothetical protein
MSVRQDLHILQGATWQFSFVYLDGEGAAVDVSNYEGRLAIRADFSSSTEAYLTSTGGEVNGTITLGADGTVTLAMTAQDTTSLLDDLSELLVFGDMAYRAERFVEFIYDLKLIGDGTTVRALQGKVIVEREVTR